MNSIVAGGDLGETVAGADLDDAWRQGVHDLGEHAPGQEQLTGLVDLGGEHDGGTGLVVVSGQAYGIVGRGDPQPGQGRKWRAGAGCVSSRERRRLGQLDTVAGESHLFLPHASIVSVSLSLPTDSADQAGCVRA